MRPISHAMSGGGPGRPYLGAAATLDRVQKEYLEMPGLALTLDQARRLFGLDASECHRVLQRLVDAGFLRIGAGRYRLNEPHV